MEGGGGATAGAPPAPPSPPPPASSPPFNAAVAAFFLPRGFPDSVTPDYLPYQLAALPVHVAGWLSSSLATTALLAAVVGGSGAPPAAAAAAVASSSAAVRWLSKDGLGAAGRLAVGSSLGAAIDDDPRRWRMVAEALTTAGLALEIGTTAAPPSAFVPLAGAAAFLRAAARGVARPASRVVQTHFSAATSYRNVGDVAAKEEVWEVAGQLAGLAAAVALLGGGGGDRPPPCGPDALAAAWLAAQAAHVGARVVALRTLRFPTLNHKRAAAAAGAWVGEGRVPTVDEANEGEPLLPAPESVRPRATLGCGVAVAVAAWEAGGGAGGLGGLLRLFPGERFALAWTAASASVLLLDGATPEDGVKALLVAAHLDAAVDGRRAATPAELSTALAAAQSTWPSFSAALAASGWAPSRGGLLTGSVRLRAAG